MGIKEWPATERPRDRLLALGPQALSDAELLAIFFRTGVKGLSALDLARSLLEEFGGLRNLLNADPGHLSRVHGVGQAKSVQLQATLEIARRYLAETMNRGDPLSNPVATRQYLAARLRDKEYEVFACLFLDSRNRVIGFEELFRGTLNRADVHTREVIKAALANNAAAVIFAHNHPSGVPQPSEADRSLTIQLKEALAMLEIRVLDHFVVGDETCVSLSELGWL
ncbi:MAG: DNA repair protein RadC [Gammaproteobacteria bacterium]|nr:DNA repair protein RadC [Gammaproteobacteria bacterium]